MKKPFLVAICGPTASGKTKVAFELAQKLNAEIINFDSVQVYQDVAIGSSQPPASMLKQIKHHLISEIPASSNFSAGDFRKSTLGLLEGELSKSEFVVLVGGTGFYLQALLKGMYELSSVDESVKAALKDELKVNGIETLFDELSKVDPESAAKIKPTDRYRILRALEVWRGTGQKISKIREEFKPEPFRYPFLQVGIHKDRTSLRSDIERRTEQMLSSGLIEETKNLLEKFGRAVKSLQSVGYKETLLYLDGLLERKDLAPAITIATMQLAKRQMTWFRRDKVEWVDSKTATQEILRKLVTHL